RLTEANIREGMRRVRTALLEADVNYEVVEDFIERVTQQAVGERVLKSLRPSEQIVGIVYEELVRLMGPVDTSIPIRRGDVTVIMMCGLQGSGKTTTCGKLARLLKKEGLHPMLVAADLQRPAAIEQLKVIGEQIGVPVYSEPPEKSTPLQVCRNALKAARQQGCDVVILDTAGRLHVDEQLMKELEQIDRTIQPHQVLLVCDAMTGQDAVRSAKAFNDALEIDGVILTKLDGDTRGGAALSVKSVTGVPIKFVGVGEQLDRLEPFRPEGMAERILGMGDIVGLVQRAQQELDQQELAEQQKKMMEGRFTLEDFQKQMRQIRRLGPMREILKMIPGVGSLFDTMDDMEDPEKELSRIDAIINSMTPDERLHPDRIDRSRRNRIARGSGTDPSEVSALLKQFDAMAKMMKEMAGMGMRDRLRAVQELATSGALSGAPLRREKIRSKRGPSDPQKLKELRRKQRKEARKAKKRNRKRR
ncbi:MAG: signal recognition particle protein, partial [Planctomycetota bacterium]